MCARHYLRSRDEASCALVLLVPSFYTATLILAALRFLDLISLVFSPFFFFPFLGVMILWMFVGPLASLAWGNPATMIGGETDCPPTCMQNAGVTCRSDQINCRDFDCQWMRAWVTIPDW
jgi:hypothetical protein